MLLMAAARSGHAAAALSLHTIYSLLLTTIIFSQPWELPTALESK